MLTDLPTEQRRTPVRFTTRNTYFGEDIRTDNNDCSANLTDTQKTDLHNLLFKLKNSLAIFQVEHT